MSQYGYTNPFSICFTMMKLRYSEYDASIEETNFVQPTDKVNVFINFESVLNNLSMVKDLDNKLLLERNFPFILESEMLNLCAHYKRFFRDNNLPTRVFLYSTDLCSDEFVNFKYNDEYRSYYINKYLHNPRFQLLGNTLKETCMPRVKKIAEFIPNVYVIDSKNIEGSLIPLIIANSDDSYKNFIITTDKYDTQYMLSSDKFCCHYIKKNNTGSKVFQTFEKYINDLFRENFETLPEDSSLFNNASFYSALIASLGNKPRSIDPVKGVGCKTIMKYLTTAIGAGKINRSTNSINMIMEAFPEDQHERIFNNFNCINLEKQLTDLTTHDIFSITSQVTDRYDLNSLMQLNREDYKEYPLMLPELTC